MDLMLLCGLVSVLGRRKAGHLLEDPMEIAGIIISDHMTDRLYVGLRFIFQKVFCCPDAQVDQIAYGSFSVILFKDPHNVRRAVIELMRNIFYDDWLVIMGMDIFLYLNAESFVPVCIRGRQAAQDRQYFCEDFVQAFHCGEHLLYFIDRMIQFSFVHYMGRSENDPAQLGEHVFQDPLGTAFPFPFGKKFFKHGP